MNPFDCLNIPAAAAVDQRIFIKDILENLDLLSDEKKLLEKMVSTVRLKAIFTEKTTGIWGYEDETYLYKEIDFFHVVLKKRDKMAALNELFQKMFPRPVVICFQYGQEYALSTASKRYGRREKDRVVAEAFQITEFFTMDGLHEELLKGIGSGFDNLKLLYESIDYHVAAIFLVGATGKIPSHIDFTIKLKSTSYQQLLLQRKQLLEEVKGATSVRERMELNSKIKEIEKRMEDLL